jgi:hypothetical protein
MNILTKTKEMETKKISDEMYNQLKADLPPEAISQHPTKTYLSSIKAIFVTERLNDVFGCGSWQIRTETVSQNDKGMVVVKTILTIPEYGVYYESFGGNDNGGDTNKNFDLGDAYKGATTDGMTKICSYLGIAIKVFKGLSNPGGKGYKFGSAKDESLPWIGEVNLNNMILTIPKDREKVIESLTKYRWSKVNREKITEELDKK